MISDRIKEIRAKSGLSQIAFAKKIGISSSGMSKIEKGENSPAERTIMLICQKFGVNRDWIENGTPPMYAEQVRDTPGTLVPALMSALKDRPALLLAMQKAVRHMRPGDWDRLDQILDEIQREDRP